MIWIINEYIPYEGDHEIHRGTEEDCLQQLQKWHEQGRPLYDLWLTPEGAVVDARDFLAGERGVV